MEPGSYLTSFRRHFFFWLDDESLKLPESVLEALGNIPELFHLSVARGLYSSLQLLDAIRNHKLPAFDIALLDVRLSRSDQYFAQLETIADTEPFARESQSRVTSIYVDDKAELHKIHEFSGPEHFGFDLDQVMGEAPESGGLFVWSWAIRLCGDAKYIIYSADELLRSRIEFLRIAGVLEICNKLELFHQSNPRDYIQNTTDPCWIKYKQLAESGFNGVTKITYIPFIHKGTTGQDVFQNVIVEMDKDFVPEGYFTSAQRRRPDRALIIHEMAISKSGDVKVVYERFDQFLARASTSPSQPYVMERVIEMLEKKIERNEIDTVLARMILSSRSNQVWTVRIGDREFQSPAHQLPLGGLVDFANRTVSFATEEEARKTYTMPTFFLPWGSALVSNEPTIITGALDGISARFGDRLKNGCGLMESFCRYQPFHSFIEQAACEKTKGDAQLARTRFDELKMDSVLLNETSAFLRDYLDADPPYRDWEKAKTKVELTFKALLARIQAYASTLDSTWCVEINPLRAALPNGKWFADMEWIGLVIETVFNNLASNKAFDPAQGFAGIPRVRVSLTKEVEPSRIIIAIEDNGVGFDVAALCAPNTGYYNLLQGQSGRLLQTYGRLTIRSTNGECDLESKQVTLNPMTDGGTLVTFSIMLPWAVV